MIELIDFKKTSFADLRTVKNRTSGSYQEVCQSLRLIDDNCEWKQVLDAALASLNGQRSRAFFATLLLSCEIPNLIELFEAFQETFIEHLRRQFEKTE